MHTMLSRIQQGLALVLGMSLTGWADSGASRDLSADRPDSTESPITVEPGLRQLETSFFSFTKSHQDGTSFESWVIGETNLKFGLTDRSDLQLVVAPYVHERERSAMGRTTSEGVGDVEVRFKWNLWGNDGGATAAGLLPWVKIPTGSDVSNDEWEGGLIVPFAWDFSERFGLGFQVEAGRAFDEGVGHYWAFSHTAVLGMAVTDQLGAFIEYVGTTSELPYQSQVSGGITFQVNEDVQFDFGGLIGLNDHSDDVTVFSGLTWRF